MRFYRERIKRKHRTFKTRLNSVNLLEIPYFWGWGRFWMRKHLHCPTPFSLSNYQAELTDPFPYQPPPPQLLSSSEDAVSRCRFQQNPQWAETKKCVPLQIPSGCPSPHSKHWPMSHAIKQLPALRMNQKEGYSLPNAWAFVLPQVELAEWLNPADFLRQQCFKATFVCPFLYILMAL